MNLFQSPEARAEKRHAQDVRITEAEEAAAIAALDTEARAQIGLRLRLVKTWRPC